MQDVKVQMRKSDLWIASRQEALRWQGFLARLPLFILTFVVLYGLGLGLLGDASKVTVPLQILIMIGYAAVYWIGYMITRLVQGWLRARRLAQALFGMNEEVRVSLSLGEKSVHLDVGEWKTTIPHPQFYMTQDFIFFNTAFAPWIPVRQSTELNELIHKIKKPDKKKGAKQSTPNHEIVE